MLRWREVYLIHHSAVTTNAVEKCDHHRTGLHDCLFALRIVNWLVIVHKNALQNNKYYASIDYSMKAVYKETKDNY